MKIFFYIILYLFSQLSWSFVISRTDAGKNIKWQKPYKDIYLNFNPTPQSTKNFVLDISDGELTVLGLTKSEYIESRTKEILQESVLQWNTVSPYKVSLELDYSAPSSDPQINSFSYSDDSENFGSGVLGVTSISHNAESGSIISANILINQSAFAATLTLDKTSTTSTKAYLGDVITHELGHFLGLGHSEITGAAMVYSIFKGQHKISSDDIAGIKKNYNLIDEQLGSLSGKIVAGEEFNTIFGVNIGLFSVKKNQHIQSQLSDFNGQFYFDNLDLNDSYYMRIVPLRNKDSISSYYSTVNNRLCGLEDFRGSFFSKCEARSKGHPQLFHFESTDNVHINIGAITIRCDESIEANYFANKYKVDNRQYSLIKYRESGALFNGFFTDYEINQGLLGKGDEYSLDLSTIDPQENLLGDLTARIGIMSTGLGSNFDFQVWIRKTGSVNWDVSSSDIDSNLKKITDRFIDINLSNDPGENIFDIKILPIRLAETDQVGIFSEISNTNNTVINKNNLYTVSAVVGFLSDNEFVFLENMNSYPYSDNLRCLDGKVSFKATPLVSKGQQEDNAQQSKVLDALAAGCGTISLDDDNGGGSGGIFSFFMGICLILSTVIFTDRRFKILS